MRNYEYVSDGDYEGLTKLELMRYEDSNDNCREIIITKVFKSECSKNNALDFIYKENFVEEESLDCYDEIKEFGELFCI